MSKVVRAIAGVGLAILGVVTGNFQLILVGASLIAGAVLGPKAPKRAAAASQLQLGEQPRQAVLGRAAVGGTLVDAFNYGGKYGTDWEVLVIALADHRCDALEGFFVDDTYVAFTGDGTVPGFNNQLQVFWRAGTWDDTVPSILTTNGPGWTANDRGRGVAKVVVAYKADASDAKNPVYPNGRPRFSWVVRGLRCYQARKDSTVGGSGTHRRDNPATWEWTENPIDIRYNWVRGIYAGDRVTEPGMLLVGRGLSAIEAPPANVFPRANLCDEVVDGQPRYRIGGVVASTESFIDVESDFAAAVGGTISQPEGAVEVDPGQAKAVVATFTDDDLLVGSKVIWNEGILGSGDNEWINTVAARFVDPAQRWAVRSAPVRRDTADVIADGSPREVQPQLDLVTSGTQAQRIAEIIRRLGRLWGRAQVTLPPRFAFIEEGDWVAWQSNRRFGGATLTFRVEAWGSDKAWHHQLTLRQISASVYSDTAPLTDGVIASTQSPPPVVAAPAAGVWNAAAVLLGVGSVRVPNLRVAGTPDDPAADFVVFEYVPQVAAPDAATIWTFASSSRPDVRLLDIPVIEGGTYWVAVSYVVDGIQGARRVIGPISTSGLAFSDGSPIAPVAPANANRVPFSRMEGGRGWTFTPSAGMTVTTALRPVLSAGRTFISVDVSATSAVWGYLRSTPMRVTAGERLSASMAIEALNLSGPALNLWFIQLHFLDALGNILAVPNVALALGNPAASVRREAFITAPASAVAAYFEASFLPGGAGSYTFSIADPMATSAAAGQTVHPPFTAGPNASDGATVGAPAGTPVAGVPAETLVAQAAQAASDATAANAAINVITSDGILSRDEKPEIRKQRDAITGEYSTIRARALFFGVPVTNYDADYAALTGYLSGLALDAATDTAITRATFNVFFTDYYAERQIVLDGIAAAASNSLITIDGAGRISGIGTANIFVDNTRTQLQGTLASRPATGAFVGQSYLSTDTKEEYLWSGTSWNLATDLTATAQREIVPQFPIIEVRQGEAGHTGNRIVTHTARRGTAALIGGSWSLAAQSLGAGTASINVSTGAVTLSAIVQSGSYTIRYTHTDGIPTDLAVNVTYIPSTASNPAFASGAIGNFTSSSFVAVTSVLQIVLPGGVTSATLTAANVDLSLLPEAPDGSTTAEFKWQRETSLGSGSWVDVGSAATSSPSPAASDTGLTDGLGNPLYTADAGLVTCTRTATGLTAGSTQNFRLVARISAGNVRTVLASGTASASA